MFEQSHSPPSAARENNSFKSYFARRMFALEVRRDTSPWRFIVITFLAVLVGVLLSIAILIGAGVPAASLLDEFGTVLLDAQSLNAVFLQTAPLVLVGTAASLAFRARYWNLGLEGQLVMGGIAATAVSIWELGPEPFRLVSMGVAAALAGAFWVLVPTLLKLKANVSEVISTLLLNYVATYFMYHLLFGAWKDPRDSFPYSPEYRSFERLPELWSGVNSSLLLALVISALTGWLALASRFGFSLKFVFENPAFARRAGIGIIGMTIGSALASGSLAGLSGFVVSSSIQGRLTQMFFSGYGFSGILIAFLARNNPLAVLPVSVFYAILFVSGQNLQVFYQIPFSIVQLIQSIIVICIASSDFFLNYRFVRRV